MTIFRGKGNETQYDDYLDFINYVFSFNGNEEDFLKLLPKLYKKEYKPCESNYIVTEDGKLKAAIGAYDSIVDVNGIQLKCRGIGNVAVHPYRRGQGYMIDCINRSIDDMIKDGVDFSMLGGQRQRYMYYGFDKGGPEYSFNLTHTNFRHAFANVPLRPFEINEVSPDDEELLTKIRDLHRTRPIHTVRDDKAFYDITCSWWRKPYAVTLGGEFKGYFVGDFRELTLVDRKDFTDVLRTYAKDKGHFSVELPEYERDYIAVLSKLAEGFSIENSEQFQIFNYEHMVNAFLKLKTTYQTLSDGCYTFLIHGKAGDENITCTVKDNVATVEKTDNKPDMELDHLEAFMTLFSVVSVRRDEMPANIRPWFPLPLFITGADHV